MSHVLYLAQWQVVEQLHNYVVDFFDNIDNDTLGNMDNNVSYQQMICNISFENDVTDGEF